MGISLQLPQERIRFYKLGSSSRAEKRELQAMIAFPCSFPFTSPSTSTPKFNSDHPHLSMLDKHCTTMKDLQKIHAHLLKTGLVKHPLAACSLLAFCATSPGGDINYAYLFFTQIPTPNLFSWNTIIRGFSQSSTPQHAIALFIDMLFSSVQPHRLTYPSVFKAYAQLGLAQYGVQLHGRVIKLGLQSDPFIRNTVIYMYANCGFFIEMWRAFNERTGFDIVAWNSMIMGLAKCGEVDQSRNLFDEMPLRNTVSWNSMISGYVRNGRYREALDLFGQMQEKRIKPSEFTMVSLLNASARLGALKQGEWIYDYIRRNDFEQNVIVTASIIDMYCKCGSIGKAFRVFQMAPRRGLPCWNTMILGLAMNGCEQEAIQLFSRLESTNLRPDNVSFLGVLTACNYLGLVDKSKDYFSSMSKTYNIEPSIKHYNCMVDTLGRAGLLEEAEELIRTMPVSPDAIIWSSLLSACRKHGNVDVAKQAAKHIVELDGNDSGSYVLLSNIYAASDQFEEALNQRLTMKEKRIEKEPGCSLIEVNGEIHEFVAGGRHHPQAKEIYSLLNELGMMFQEMG